MGLQQRPLQSRCGNGSLRIPSLSRILLWVSSILCRQSVNPMLIYSSPCLYLYLCPYLYPFPFLCSLPYFYPYLYLCSPCPCLWSCLYPCPFLYLSLYPLYPFLFPYPYLVAYPLSDPYCARPYCPSVSSSNVSRLFYQETLMATRLLFWGGGGGGIRCYCERERESNKICTSRSDEVAII